jgi:hypothetical protein
LREKEARVRKNQSAASRRGSTVHPANAFVVGFGLNAHWFAADPDTDKLVLCPVENRDFASGLRLRISAMPARIS